MTCINNRISGINKTHELNVRISSMTGSGLNSVFMFLYASGCGLNDIRRKMCELKKKIEQSEEDALMNNKDEIKLYKMLFDDKIHHELNRELPEWLNTNCEAILKEAKDKDKSKLTSEIRYKIDHNKEILFEKIDMLRD